LGNRRPEPDPPPWGNRGAMNRVRAQPGTPSIWRSRER